MRSIMVMNAKGGCGKTTVATNLATYLADNGNKVVIADFDPQGSSMDWLAARNDYEGIPDIGGIAAWEDRVIVPRSTDFLIMDVPAGVHGKRINEMLQRVETLIVPILPSPIDMRAGTRFLKELLASGRVSRKQTRIAIVANRVRENTRILHELESYLADTRIPCISYLRESQNYIRSAETGLGLFEMAPSAVYQDLEQWVPLVEWINSKKSRSAARPR